MRLKTGLVAACLATLLFVESRSAAVAADFRNAVLSASEDGAAQTRFPADTPEIFIRSEMVDVTPGSVVTITWLAVDTGAENPPNFRLNRLSLPVGRVGRLFRSSMVRPGERWLPGSYRARLDLDGRALERIDFTIE